MVRKTRPGVATHDPDRYVYWVDKKHRKVTPEYGAWCGIRERCLNTKSKDYPRWGGRGVTVHPDFRSFDLFLAHVGKRPPGMASLDRIDNSKGYEPGNVRWATPKTQSRNSRWNRLTMADVIAIRARTASQKTIAAEFGVSRATVCRVVNGKIWQ